MRNRFKTPWTTFDQIADFFPHIFRKKARAKSNDLSFIITQLLDSGFIISKDNNNTKEYSITSLGLSVPFIVVKKLKKDINYSANYQEA